MRFLPSLLVATAIGLAAPAMAEPLTLERVYASPSLSGGGLRGLQLSPNGDLMTILRAREDQQSRYDLWALDTTTRQWRMLVDSEKVGTGAELSEAEKMQRERERIGALSGIVTYQWSTDGQTILVPLDGDLYLANIDGNVTRLTDSSEGELNPTISPKGHYVAFARDRQLYVGKVGEDEPVAITPKEGETIYWGEAEFVAQEEMDRLTGYWWSPDDRYLAVQRFDESPVDIVTRTSIGNGGTRTYQQRYPAAGTDNVISELYVMSPDGSNRVKVDLGDNQDIYIARVDWARDGSTLYVQRENRAQTILDILAVDPTTGETEILFTEKAAEGHWINLSDSYKWLKDGSLIWWSERDGYGHLYQLNPNGDWRQLTSGQWVVKSLAGVDEEKGVLYFNGNRETPLGTQIFSLDYRTDGAVPTLLSDPEYSSSASMDGKASRMIVTRSSETQPSQVFLADTSGDRLAWVDENKLDENHPYYPYLDSHEPTRFGSLTAPDGQVLDYEMVLPPNMKEGERYPVFFQHYGGPHSQEVMLSWDGPLKQWIVDQGYIYFKVENRGGANRGVDYEKPLYRAMGQIEVEDQKVGALYLKTLDFVDPDRIAINGWSYGGFLTLMKLIADPGLFAAGIAGAPVAKWEFYDTFYTERYMGDPREVPEAYRRSNPYYGLDKISDPLLIMHGMSDDNVVLDNTTAIATSLQERAYPFSMMLYPGHTHSVGGEKISVHMWTTIMDFLKQHGIEGGPR